MNMNYREYVWKSIWFLLDTVKRTKSEIRLKWNLIILMILDNIKKTKHKKKRNIKNCDDIYITIFHIQLYIWSTLDLITILQLLEFFNSVNFQSMKKIPIYSSNQKEREMHCSRETLSYNWNAEFNQSVKHISSGATWKLIMKSRFQDNKRWPLWWGGKNVQGDFLSPTLRLFPACSRAVAQNG